MLANAGTIALELLAALLMLYIAVKWWQRQRLLRALRMARITADELNHAMADGDAPVVVDVRSAPGRAFDSRIIPGALLADPNEHRPGGARHSAGSELVIYCNCPNEGLGGEGGQAADGGRLPARAPAAGRAGRMGGGRLSGRPVARSTRRGR